MPFGRIWVLRGPNTWADFPVIEAEVESTTLADARQLLIRTQQLQRAALEPTSFGSVQTTRRDGFFRIVFSFEEDRISRACLESAAQPDIDLSAEGERLRHLALETRLGPSTRAIVDAAKARGIPVRRLNDGSLVQLGWGIAQQRIWTAETDATPAIAETLAQDKERTRKLLAAIGVPVPWGRPVSSADDAWTAAQEIGGPVVVKPQYGNQGRGVATNLSTREQVLTAYTAARAESEYIMVETYLPGADHRLLVVGDRLVAAALREPAHIIGDGRSTIRTLIDEVNRDPRRSDGHGTALSFLKIDAIALAVLAEQDCTPDSIPETGRKVFIRRNANLSTGGTATDITERVHPAVAASAIDAARAVGLDIAGVDVVAEDVRQPLDVQNGGIVEVNAGPGLRMHLEPSAGTPQPVGEAIIDNLFPPPSNGRIPIISITGTNGKTTTTRLIAHLFRTAGRFVGMTCTDGVYFNGRRTETRDCSGPQSARQVLLHPSVEVAVLETARGGILREGLGFDRCAVGVVTNIGKGDHLGLRGIETIEELARVKGVVPRSVASTGYTVLNALDPLVAAMAETTAGQVIFFARQHDHPVVRQHLEGGGRAVFIEQEHIVLAQGGERRAFMSVHDIELTRDGHVPFQVENVLAAVASADALGLPHDIIRASLRTFTGNSAEVPGRFNVLHAGSSTVIVDYAHNPSAVEALIAGLDAFPQPQRTIVFSGCNRRDSDLLEMGEAIGDAFDRVILYADWGHSGRADGELNAVLRQGLSRGSRTREIIDYPTERSALEASMHGLHGAELLVIGVEAIEESLAFVENWLRNANVAN